MVTETTMKWEKECVSVAPAGLTSGTVTDFHPWCSESVFRGLGFWQQRQQELVFIPSRFLSLPLKHMTSEPARQCVLAPGGRSLLGNKVAGWSGVSVWCD